MRKLRTLFDKELLEQMTGGPHAEQAFEELYNRYWSKLYMLAYNRLRSREAAEEIVQDFFTSIWVKRNSLRIDQSFATYMHSAIRYNVINYWQKEYIRKRYREEISVTTGTDYNTEDTIGVNDLKRVINEELCRLPERCRTVYNLSRNDYKTNKEIAMELGISEKTVENQLTKALGRIRLGLQQAFLTLLLFFFF